MRKLTEKERTHITWFFILGSLALILWLIGFFFEYGNFFIEDISSTYQREIPREKPYTPNYSQSGEK